MRLFAIIVIFLILLCSISFASILWRYPLSSAIITDPIIFNDNVVMGAENGYIYALSLQGTPVWRTNVGKTILQPAIFQGELLVPTTSGKILVVRRDGTTRANIDFNKLATINSTLIYGIGAATNRIYLTTNRGLFSMDLTGKSNLILEINGTLTPPYIDNQRVIFGANNEIIYLRLPANEVLWRRTIGEVWTSKPVFEENTAYIGSLDNYLYAIDILDGVIKWRARTDGWVVGSALVDGSNVYFGSNDGYVYAVDKFTGLQVWKKKTQQAVQTTPITGIFGSNAVVFVGSTDGGIYAFDKIRGDILWHFSVNDWVSSPVTIGNGIIFGSRNSFVYGASNSKGCAINFPENGAIIGSKEVKLKGFAISDAGIIGVGIKINDGNFQDAQLKNNDWTYIINPASLNPGVNTVYCMVSDSAGAENEPFSSITLLRPLNASKGKFSLTYSRTIEEKKEFTLFVNDAEDGSLVENFAVSFEGKMFNGTGNITLKPTGSGIKNIVVKKAGFDDANVSFEVKTSSNTYGTVLPIIVIIAILFILVQLYRRFARKS